MNQPLPTIDSVLDIFFAKHIECATGVKRQRILQIEVLLREYLEGLPDTFFTTPELAILRSEREFDPDGAIGRVMNAEALLYALPKFVEPRHLQMPELLQREQLRLVGNLANYLVSTPLRADDYACVQLDLGRALDKAKVSLDRSRRERERSQQMQSGGAYENVLPFRARPKS